MAILCAIEPASFDPLQLTKFLIMSLNKSLETHCFFDLKEVKTCVSTPNGKKFTDWNRKQTVIILLLQMIFLHEKSKREDISKSLFVVKSYDRLLLGIKTAKAYDQIHQIYNCTLPLNNHFKIYKTISTLKFNLSRTLPYWFFTLRL